MLCNVMCKIEIKGMREAISVVCFYEVLCIDEQTVILCNIHMCETSIQ